MNQLRGGGCITSLLLWIRRPWSGGAPVGDYDPLGPFDKGRAAQMRRIIYDPWASRAGPSWPIALQRRHVNQRGSAFKIPTPFEGSLSAVWSPCTVQMIQRFLEIISAYLPIVVIMKTFHHSDALCSAVLRLICVSKSSSKLLHHFVAWLVSLNFKLPTVRAETV